MKIDLQVHTLPASRDSIIEASDLPEACVRSGIDGIALTEHDPPDHSEAIAQMTAAGLLAITAREVSCIGAHLLVISEDEDLLRELPRVVEPTHPLLGRRDVAVIWAHPAAPSGSSAYAPVSADPERLRGVVHAVEVLNGRHLHFPDAVERAEQLAAQLGVGRSGGSDAHRQEDVGRCFTEIDADASDGTAGVVEAIRVGRVAPVLSRAWSASQDYDYRSSLTRYLG